MTVYGRSSPTADYAKEQWSSYTIDLQTVLSKAPNDTDVIFLGDTNARIGRAVSEIEEQTIGKYGEKNAKRNLGGTLAIQFLQECNLRSLNARSPSASPPYTFHSRAQGHSLIDIIAVSTSMFRLEYEALPMEEITLTGKEDHLPVISTIRLKRRKPKPVKRVPKVIWNIAAMNSERKKEKFINDRNSALIPLLINFEEREEQGYNSKEFLKDILKITINSAEENIGKRQVFYKYHISRSMKKESKLRKAIKSHCRKFKAQIKNPESEAHRKLQNMKEEITALQLKHTKERERYLDRSINNSYETNNMRKLSELVRNYEEDNFRGKDVAISCIRDAEGMIRTSNDSIRQVFENKWRKVFSHEQDAKELEHFQLTDQECKDKCTRRYCFYEFYDGSVQPDLIGIKHVCNYSAEKYFCLTLRYFAGLDHGTQKLGA